MKVIPNSGFIENNGNMHDLRDSNKQNLCHEFSGFFFLFFDFLNLE